MCLFILATAGAVGIGGGAMTLDGALEVVFEDGLPKPIRPKTPATLTLTSMSTSISTQPKEDRDRAGFEKRINEIKQLRGEPNLKPPKPVRSTLKKAYPSNITSNTNMNVPEVMYNPPTKSNDHSIAKMNASSISSATTSAGLGSWSHNTNMEMKSNSSLGSDSPTTATTSKKKVTFASILESMRNHPHSISNASKEDRLESQQKLKAETSNWSEVWSQAAKATTTTTSTTSPSPSLSVHTSIKKPPQSVSGRGSVARKEDKKLSELSSAKTKKTAKKGIDTGIIVERTPTGPMSEAAIMMKMEPEKSTMDDAAATNAASSSSSSSSSHSGDKKESSEDEPSAAEVAARSIEGYIQLPDGSSMAVARPGHVRVAPRTLLQGLSYSPFPTATVATVAAVTASSKTSKDEGEQSTDSEVEDEEDTRYAEFEAHVRYCWLGFFHQLVLFFYCLEVRLALTISLNITWRTFFRL